MFIGVLAILGGLGGLTRFGCGSCGKDSAVSTSMSVDSVWLALRLRWDWITRRGTRKRDQDVFEDYAGVDVVDAQRVFAWR